MTLCSQSNGFDYLDPNLCTLESLFGRIRNWMRRAGNKLVYNLYIIEAKYRFFYYDCGVYSKRSILVYALSDDHAINLSRNRLTEYIENSEQQEFTIHLIHLPGLHESPMVFPDC
jgi:hypothetical protein